MRVWSNSGSWVTKCENFPLAGKGWLTVGREMNPLRDRERASGGKVTMALEKEAKLNSLYE